MEVLDLNEVVLDFIKGFESAKQLFLYGYCYWFAVILSQRFDGEIWYLPIPNHFICKINNRFYDVEGEVNPPRVKYKWNRYPDQLEKARIIRDCINKENV